jgi:hypothetical protein
VIPTDALDLRGVDRRLVTDTATAVATVICTKEDVHESPPAIRVPSTAATFMRRVSPPALELALQPAGSDREEAWNMAAPLL